MSSDPRIIVALDFPDAGGALALAARLDPKLCRVKVGKELYTAAGPSLVEKLHQSGYAVFLDLKYHDIPSTVAGACLAAARLGVWMINVHALGGRAMMLAAREALAQSAKPPRLVAVTLLTSMGAGDMADIGLAGSPQDAVLRLARLAQDCGLDGVVCSAQEATALRHQCGKAFCLVTPGVRPADAAPDDQSRVATPRQAITAGSDYLVIGRPITRAPDPLAALRRICDEIARR
ncbi:MAG: orotidine 5'-phosphate decarboxylase [Betaproteobacteria bacterium RIFCSPLOWO2_02_FULL_67_26]|nr:MAG: orotidine 5'-phosphate decarboxylase [Betaproteobacteria bacterium RIFCSPLOWO2_02_FULL_67_26]